MELTSEEIRERLTSHGPTILENLAPRLDVMFLQKCATKGIILEYEQISLLAIADPIERCDVFLEKVKTGSVDNFKPFLDVLRKYGLKDLADLLDGKIDSVAKQGGAAGTSSKRHQSQEKEPEPRITWDEVINCITNQGPGLLMRLGVALKKGTILADCVKESIIQGYQKLTLDAETDPFKSSNSFLEIVKCGSVKNFVKFRKVLIANNQEELAKNLEIPSEKDTASEGSSKSDSASTAPEEKEKVGSPEENTGPDEVDIGHDKASAHGSDSAAAAADLNTVEKMIDDVTCDAITGYSPKYDWYTKDYKDLVHLGKRAKPVVIALLDTGVAKDHPALKEISIESKNYTGEADNVGNHGTMMAGILQQHAAGIKIISYEVLDADGYGDPHNTFRALKDIQESKKIDIVSISLGSRSYDRETAQLVGKLSHSKVLIAAACNAGKQSENTIGYPAKYDGVIAVGSCNEMGERSNHSSIGRQLDFLFPGEDVQTTQANHKYAPYTLATGTSLATPHCAALAALILRMVEDKFGEEMRTTFTCSHHIKSLLEGTCRGDFDKNRGHGKPKVKDISVHAIEKYIKEEI